MFSFTKEDEHVESCFSKTLSSLSINFQAVTQQCHLPDLCNKEVSLLWALLKLSSDIRRSPVGSMEDIASSLGNALLICHPKNLMWEFFLDDKKFL